MKNILLLALIAICVVGCKQSDKDKNPKSQAKIEYYYIETVGFDNDLEAMFKKGICNKYSSFYMNDIFKLQDTEPILNDSNLYIFKYLDANTLPDSNFVDNLHKLRVTLYKSDTLTNNRYMVEVFKSEDAGKWLRVRNMGEIKLYYEPSDTILSRESLCERMQQSLFIGMWK